MMVDDDDDVQRASSGRQKSGRSRLNDQREGSASSTGTQTHRHRQTDRQTDINSITV